MAGVPCFLALDLGTTNCRCLAIDAQGGQLAAASCEITLHHPQPSYAEADPAEWWAAVRQVAAEVMDSLHTQAVRPAALGLTGLQHAMVPIDEHGHLLRRAMLWMDQRCQPQVARLNAQAGPALESALWPGARVTATPSLPKLLWLAENDPALVRQTWRFLLPKDYIRFRLTGVVATDPSDAGGTMMVDRRSKGWSPELVRLAGIRPDQLPPIRSSTSLAGAITSEAAALTGLPEGLAVVVGAGDVRATVLGMGGELSGRALVYLGTAAWVMRESGGAFGIHATATTGAALRWLRDLLRSSYEELVTEAGAVAPGSDGLIFLPHLCGERAPFFSPDVCGSLTGLSLMHGRGHLARAVLEGCACHLRWLMEDAQPAPDCAVIAGGGAQSATWVGILANALGVPALVPQVSEAGAMGAAILAAVGSGRYSGEAEAVAQMVHLSPGCAPNERERAIYEDVYRRFRRTEDLLAAEHGDRGSR